jgi:hypothetical protein
MSTPIVDLTTDEYAEILRLERVAGDAYERIRAIRLNAAADPDRGNVAPEWLATHA